MKVCAKATIRKMWDQTQRSARWKAMMAAMGCSKEPVLPRVQFRRDMTSTLMMAHYHQGGPSILLTVNRHWYLSASKANIRSVVRHEMVHFALGANGKADHHGPVFYRACKMVHGDHK